MRKLKDPVSGLTHLAGAIASVVGLVFLIIYAVKYGEGAIDVVSFTLFGSSLVLLYTSSSIYHLLNVSEKVTKLLRRIDHIMIYVLIAGSYTPVVLGPLIGGWGWSIFGVIWGLTLLGLFLTIFWLKAPRWLTTGIYLLMGWIAIIAIYPMIKIFIEKNAFNSLFWLLLGGICYTVGAVLYGLKWPNFKNKYFGFHEIFHILVMIGSLSHFWFIIRYVLYI